jgi:hypothetical protein
MNSPAREWNAGLKFDGGTKLRPSPLSLRNSVPVTVALERAKLLSLTTQTITVTTAVLNLWT